MSARLANAAVFAVAGAMLRMATILFFLAPSSAARNDFHWNFHLQKQEFSGLHHLRDTLCILLVQWGICSRHDHDRIFSCSIDDDMSRASRLVDGANERKIDSHLLEETRASFAKPSFPLAPAIRTPAPARWAASA
jgi:hypothetical protein